MLICKINVYSLWGWDWEKNQSFECLNCRKASNWSKSFRAFKRKVTATNEASLSPRLLSHTNQGTGDVYPPTPCDLMTTRKQTAHRPNSEQLLVMAEYGRRGLLIEQWKFLYISDSTILILYVNCRLDNSGWLYRNIWSIFHKRWVFVMLSNNCCHPSIVQMFTCSLFFFSLFSMFVVLGNSGFTLVWKTIKEIWHLFD